LIGSFNPVIFVPLWFANQGLLPVREAESADIQIVHREVTSFSLEWLGLQVTPDRFTASTTDSAHLEPVKDLVLGAFSVLEHTPLRMMGMNRDIHRKLPSQEVLNRIGSRLVSNGFWRHTISDSRPQSIKMTGRRPNIEDAVLNLTIEASAKLVPGMYMGFNEHYEVEDDSPKELLLALDQRWRQYQTWAKETAEQLLLFLMQEAN
jgi:hypothetical protein